MFRFTRIMLIVLGGSALIIGLMIFLLGPHMTAKMFGAMFGSIIGSEAYSGGLEHPNSDSEMRFYSVFWMAYGGSLLWLTARKMQQSTWVYAALGLFFLGGVGRLISYLVAGAPDLLFVTLMWIELIGPVIVAVAFAIGIGKGAHGH